MQPRWRASAEAGRAEPAVFVVGVPRSGTTALRNTLERHTSFAPRRPGSVETRVFLRPRRVLRLLEPAGETLLEFMLGDRELAARAVEDARAAEPPEAEQWIRIYFHYAKRARGVRRLLEKTPGHAAHLDAIWSAFPSASVLACIRHPVDALSSYRKRLARVRERGRYREELRWLAAPPDEFARAWAGMVERLQRAAEQRPDRLRLLRYEDLTADPGRALAGVCAFLGEPFEEAALVSGVEEARDASGSPRLHARLAPSRKRWRDFLDADAARAVEDALAEPMRRAGYARYS
jgi:hypothetical protein